MVERDPGRRYLVYDTLLLLLVVLFIVSTAVLTVALPVLDGCGCDG